MLFHCLGSGGDHRPVYRRPNSSTSSRTNQAAFTTGAVLSAVALVFALLAKRPVGRDPLSRSLNDASEFGTWGWGHLRGAWVLRKSLVCPPGFEHTKWGTVSLWCMGQMGDNGAEVLSVSKESCRQRDGKKATSVIIGIMTLPNQGNFLTFFSKLGYIATEALSAILRGRD